MSQVKLTDTEARGRSGWFKAMTAVVVFNGVKHVLVNIERKRPSFPGPVFLGMCLEDARSLGEAILTVVSEADGS